MISKQSLPSIQFLSLKIIPALLAMSCLLAFSNVVQARDTLQTFPVADTLNNDQLEGVQFFFGPESHPEVDKQYGEFTSNKKTNAFNKDDKTACDWAFLGALLSLRDRALSLGGDAVINIRSYYKKHDFREAGSYQCGAGNILAGVTMKGTVVKLK